MIDPSTDPLVMSLLVAAGVLLGHLMATYYVNRVALIGRRHPGYWRSLFTVMLGFVLLVVIGFFVPQVDGVLNFVILIGMVLITGAVYRLRLKTSSGKSLSYIKAVSIAFVAQIILVFPILVSLMYVGYF